MVPTKPVRFPVKMVVSVGLPAAVVPRLAPASLVKSPPNVTVWLELPFSQLPAALT